MSKFDLDERHWPLVRITLEDNMGDEDHDGLLAALEETFTKKRQGVAVFDLRGVRHLANAKQRARIAARSRQIEPLMARSLMGIAIVVSNPVVRGVLTAIQWLQQPIIPMAFFRSMTEACDWCMERLRVARIAPSPALVAYRERLGRHSA